MQAARKGRDLLLAIGLLLLMASLAGCGRRGASGAAVDTGSGTNGGEQPGFDTATATPTPAPTFTNPVPTLAPTPTLTLLAGSPSLGDPFTPELGNTGYDARHYLLQLAIDPAAGTLAGSATLEAVTTMPKLREISLDFVGLEVSRVTVDGLEAAFRREAGKLWVTFPQPMLVEGTPFSLQVAYAGQPAQVDSPYIHYVDYLGVIFPGNNTFYTLSEPDGARFWFPANDHPLDKATFRFELTVPRGIAAIANGRLIDSSLSTMPDGTDAATFVWDESDPMATYLALAAGGHYLREEGVSPQGIPLVYYFFPELEEPYREAVGITGEAIDWMSTILVPYPFDSYGQATYYALGISMEMQTMTLLSYQMLDERTVIHEMAHSWFGNWVGIEDWGETWIKEGLATYMEILWLGRNDPDAAAARIAEIEAEIGEKGHDYPLDQPPRDRVLSFDSYYRGALVIHALHEEIGDDAFFAGLRIFLERYGGENASYEDFRSAMEEAAGRSLDDAFARWLAAGPVAGEGQQP